MRKPVVSKLYTKDNPIKILNPNIGSGIFHRDITPCLFFFIR